MQTSEGLSTFFHRCLQFGNFINQAGYISSLQRPVVKDANLGFVCRESSRFQAEQFARLSQRQRPWWTAHGGFDRRVRQSTNETVRRCPLPSAGHQVSVGRLRLTDRVYLQRKFGGKYGSGSDGSRKFRRRIARFSVDLW